ncbi:hypothetical protein QJS04_geneDACA006056 [Acorus gramineus]|uniref:Uncharacterized protein n=1 Tax=Acorus gramineus TaxID=55184 RepID=A0AAV9B6A8_ACOGR|nr:hypothetical protein QJS04_geneDACA006056 [Acorus gramineus]
MAKHIWWRLSGCSGLVDKSNSLEELWRAERWLISPGDKSVKAKVSQMLIPAFIWALWISSTHLKLISIALIFFTSAVGISSPVFPARLFRGSPAYAHTLLLSKCYATGVILSTSLPRPRLPRRPWRDFPFSGFVSMAVALVVDVAAISSSVALEATKFSVDQD